MPGQATGNATEAMVLSALAQRDLRVLIPFGDGHPYDLVVDLEGAGFLRVQCKTAWSAPGCLVFNSRSTDHGRGPRSYRGLADVFGVYFPLNRRVYLVPIDSVAETKGRLRLEAPLNNQRRRVRLAAEFEIDRWSKRALAEIAGGPVLKVA